MIIRRATEADAESLLRMYGELYKLLSALGLPFSLSKDDLEHILPTLMKSKMCCLAVAEDETGICGFVSAAVSRMDRKLNYGGEAMIGIINDIFAVQRVRGGGVAAMLLAYAEDFFTEKGVSMVESEVIVKNEASAAFFRKNGYGELAQILYKTLPRKES